MIYGYDKLYLRKAEISIGSMLDFAVYSLHMKAPVFMDLFIASGLAERFEAGDVRILAGTSGIELAYAVMKSCGQPSERVHPRITNRRSKELLCGEAIAHYQWEYNVSFSRIIQLKPISALLELSEQLERERRKKLSEAWPPVKLTPDEEELARLEDIESLCKSIKPITDEFKETNLKTIRLRCGLSQSRLAEASGIPIRTIQQYEQRQKNINRAQAESIFRLATVLHCNPAILLER